MPENWPVRSDYNWLVRSDYNSDYTGTWAEAKGVCGFDLKILKKLCSLGQIQSSKKKFVHGEDVQPHLICPKD